MSSRRRTTHDPASSHAKQVASRLENRLKSTVIEPRRQQYDIAGWVDRRRYVVLLATAVLVASAIVVLALATREAIEGRTTSCLVAALLVTVTAVVWWPNRGFGPHRRLRLRVGPSGVRYDAIRDGRVHTFLLRDEWLRSVTVRRGPWWRLRPASLEMALLTEKLALPSSRAARLHEFATGSPSDGCTTVAIPFDDCSAPALSAALTGVLPGLWVDPVTGERPRELAGSAAAFGRMVAPRSRDVLHHFVGGVDVYLLAAAICLLVFAIPLPGHNGLVTLGLLTLVVCSVTVAVRMGHHVRRQRFLALGENVRLVGPGGPVEVAWDDVDAVTLRVGGQVSSVIIEASPPTGPVRLDTWMDFWKASQVRFQQLLDDCAPRPLHVEVVRTSAPPTRESSRGRSGPKDAPPGRGPAHVEPERASAGAAHTPGPAAASAGLLRFRAWQRVDRPTREPSGLDRFRRGFRLIFKGTPMALYPTRPMAGQISLDRPGLPVPGGAVATALLVVSASSGRWWSWLVAVAAGGVVVWYARRLHKPDRALRASSSGLSLLTSNAGPVPAITARATSPGVGVTSCDWSQVAAVTLVRRQRGGRELLVYLYPGADQDTHGAPAVPPAPDLPDRALRLPLRWYAVPQAMNLMRWFAPDLLVDPTTGNPVLGLPEPDDAADEAGLRQQGRRPTVVGRLGRAGLSGAVVRSTATVVRSLLSFLVLAGLVIVAIAFVRSGDLDELGTLLKASGVPVALALYGLLGFVRAFCMRPEYLVFGQEELRYSDGPGYLPIAIESIRQARLHGRGVARRLQLELTSAPPDPVVQMLLAPDTGPLTPVLDLKLHLAKPDSVQTDLAAAFAQRTEAPFAIDSWPLGEPGSSSD